MSYNYTDATFDSDIPFFPSPNHPDTSSPDLVPCPPDPADPTADTGTCQHVRKGDTIPGIPKHRFKAGIDYWMTPKWMIGGDLLAASSQFFFGDEANLSRTLGGYTRVNLHTSYDLTEHVQVYGLIENLFDQQYASYGTYFSVDDANELTPVTGVTFSEDNNRSVTPAIPFAAYGGVRVKF
jgi:outer membrane receptor protein involved in Fe transport